MVTDGPAYLKNGSFDNGGVGRKEMEYNISNLQHISRELMGIVLKGVHYGLDDEEIVEIVSAELRPFIEIMGVFKMIIGEDSFIFKQLSVEAKHLIRGREK